MDIFIEKFNNKEHIVKFLQENNIEKYQIKKIDNGLKINFPDKSYTNQKLEILKRHFSFYDIFYWSEGGIENVTLWENPPRIRDVLKEFKYYFGDLDFDSITSIEARGFIMGGIFANQYQKPFIPIRKYREIYKKMDGIKKEYINWKEQKEKLFIFKHSLKGTKAIFIDDILDTGRSLKTAVSMLKEKDIEVVGAFYLMDNTTQKVRDDFDFPIKSLLRFKNIFSLLD